MADNRASGSALLQRTQEMRARAAIVLNFVPNSDGNSDDRWGDALVTSLARDVVALTEELERVAGVSGSPDETRENAEALARRIKIALEYGLQVWRTTPTRVHFHTAFDALNELLALAGVGEHRPDQPHVEFCGDPYAHSAHEWIRGALPVDCPGTWMPSAVREQEA